ncbi:MAG: DoxX family protein [Chlamydiales bacterium]
MMQNKPNMSWWKQIYLGLVKGENFLGSFFLLIIRLYWGGLLIMTGIGKWTNIYEVADFFASLNIPLPLFSAYFVGGVEFFGGISLFVGLFSRLFTILLTIVFAVAYATAHEEALVQFFSTPSLFIEQSPFLFLYTTLVVLCFGPGFISFDYWLERKAFGRGLR